LCKAFFPTYFFPQSSLLHYRSFLLSAVDMVRARYKNWGRQIPQNRLASYNTGEETERKSRQTWEEGLQKILKERGIKRKGVRTITRNHERSIALRKPSTPAGRRGSTKCRSFLLLLSLLSPSCRVFTIMYQKQTMFLWYTVMQLFCIYNMCYMECYFAREICCYYIIIIIIIIITTTHHHNHNYSYY